MRVLIVARSEESSGQGDEANSDDLEAGLCYSFTAEGDFWRRKASHDYLWFELVTDGKEKQSRMQARPLSKHSSRLCPRRPLGYPCGRMTKTTFWRLHSLAGLRGSAILFFTFAVFTAVGGEWRTLFDGRDLTNWTQNGSARWRVKDGIIEGGQEGDPKRAGLLSTKEKFKDFELELEFMIDEHGKYNSGVYLRNNTNTAGRTGYQVNIGRPEAEEYIGLYTD